MIHPLKFNMKHKEWTLRQEDLNNVDMRFKFVSLQCFCIKKLYNCFHEWKIITLHLVKFLALPLNSIRTFILKVKFQETFRPFSDRSKTRTF